MRVLGLDGGWPLVPLIAYTPYVMPVAVVALIVGLALRQWAAAGLAALATVALLAVIAPRAFGGPDDLEGRSLRVMSANVLRGRADPDAVLEAVRERRVEVLTVQELTPRFARRFERAGASRFLPHSSLATRPGVIGSGIYSRYPIAPGPRGEYVTQTRGTIDVERGLRLGVISTHPILPTTPGQIEEWKVALDGFPDPAARGPVWLLIGDFNATLDQAEFRRLLDRGYADAGERLGKGLTPTWPAIDKPFRFLPVTIDHVLYDRDRVGARDYRVLDLPGSDHRAVYAELVIGS